MNDSEKEIKVIGIITPYQIVLNKGTEDGVKNGLRVLVYGLGQEMRDPDTNEVIEQLEIIRGRGKVVHTQKKICTVDCTDVQETPTTIKKRSGIQPYISIFGSGETEESEIRRTQLPFTDVQIGDRARIFLAK